MHPLIPFYPVPVFEIPIPGFGTLPIHGFGLLVALGFIFGGNVAMERARKSGLDPEVINRLLSWLVVGTFIGGHVGYGLMYKPAEYLANPIEFLKVWQGLSSFGGFVVCVPLSFWFFRKEKLPIWPYMDSLAIGLSLGWFLGRMGCTVAHDHPGTPSDFWLAKYCRPVEGHTLVLPNWMMESGHQDFRWGPCAQVGAPITDLHNQLNLSGYSGVVSAHDMGFYEALWSLSVFFLFVLLDRWPRRPGFYVTLLGVLYAPVRFFMDYLRPTTTDVRYLTDLIHPAGVDPRYYGLTPGQMWSIVFLVVSAYGLWKRVQTTDRPVGPTAPLTPEEGGHRASTSAAT